VKRGRIQRLGRPAAAMAMLTLQTYSPEGGRGHRTGLRGGGPLTTLIDPRIDDEGGSLAHQRPLWSKLWANVETRDQWAKRSSRRDPPSQPSGIWPWLEPTRVSDARGVTTTSEQVHPLQAYFGLPRRIRLEFAGPGQCDLTATFDEQTAIGFRMGTYGVQYVAWTHPLSPYRASAKGEWFPVHGQPGGIGWRDWAGLTLRKPSGGLSRPAATVSAFNERAARIGLKTVRLHVFGFDMKSAKAREWSDAAMPVFAVSDDAKRRLLSDTAGRLTEGTGIAASALLAAVQRALFHRPEDVPGDMSQVKSALWEATASAFYTAMHRLAQSTATREDADGACIQFARTLASHATEVFDRWCAEGGTTPVAMRRLVSARFNLVMTLGGHSKFGEKLFETLEIPLPGGGRAARAAKSRSRKEATS
jgi:CRISPR system Cascade subunit CasA